MDSAQLYKELENGLDIIPAFFAGVSQTEASYKPNPDQWSMLEVLCHLYDEEREDFRQRIDLLLHHAGTAWPPIDPGGWVISRAYNQRNLSQVLEAWQVERRNSLAWLDSLQEPDWETGMRAPWGGMMRAGDLLGAWVAHDNLHTRQLVELRRIRLVHLAQPFDVGYAGDW